MKPGDPTFIGWTITVGYLATAGLCLHRATGLDSRPLERAGLRGVWFTFGLFLFAMGLNKQLDLQLVVTDIGRRMARAQGWYENRGLVQIAFVVLLGLLLMSVGALLLIAARRHLAETALAFVGAGILVVFILLRAISYDVRDVLLRIGDTNVTGSLELLGTLLIAIAALRTQTDPSDQRR
jgi:hypothetical protein